MVLDISKLSTFCDYFVICSADSQRQVRSIYEEALKRCGQEKIKIHHREEDVSAKWLLLDVFGVILHVFLDKEREFYNLEYLWREAKRVRLIKKRTK